MSIVVKIGGVLLQDPAKAVAALKQAIDGPAVVVHGGGIQITRMLERMNTPSSFVEGLRVTDDSTLHAVSLALMGEVHTALVQGMQMAGMPAIGIFGGVRAKKKEGPWGLVGTEVEADFQTFHSLLLRGKIPVVPTLALGNDSLLNVNGDETAAAMAVAVQASRLVFLTDVPGVKDAKGAVIPSASNVDELLASSFVSGGMIPKLRAVKSAMTGGVPQVLVGRTVFEGAR